MSHPTKVSMKLAHYKDCKALSNAPIIEDKNTGTVGPTGPAGPQGSQGIPGNVGPTGPQGIRGFDGRQGVPGAIGPMGPTGPAGEGGVEIILFDGEIKKNQTNVLANITWGLVKINFKLMRITTFENNNVASAEYRTADIIEKYNYEVGRNHTFLLLQNGEFKCDIDGRIIIRAW